MVIFRPILAILGQFWPFWASLATLAKTFGLGSEPPHQEENFKLSYTPLPQCIWPGSPKKFEFSFKNAQKLEFSGNPDEVGNPEKQFLLGDGPPHRVDHFDLSYAPLGQTSPVGEPKKPKISLKN